MRGISFEIPNTYGKHLLDMLCDIQITSFFWQIGAGESYYIADDQLDQELFPPVENITGKYLYDIIAKEDYYVIFVNLKAFLSEQAMREIENYDMFLESECQLALFIIDTSHVHIYAKDQQMIQQLYTNAVAAKYEHIRFIVDDDDMLTTFNVF